MGRNFVNIFVAQKEALNTWKQLRVHPSKLVRLTTDKINHKGFQAHPASFQGFQVPADKLCQKIGGI